MGGRARRRMNHQTTACVFPDLDSQTFLLDLEFRQVVLAHEIEDLLQLLDVDDQISSNSVVTSVRTSTPLAVTRTSSSMRTPPQSGRYAPGSMVKTIPAATASSGESAISVTEAPGRRFVIRGSSCTSIPSP